jgi:hypothetical protein
MKRFAEKEAIMKLINSNPKGVTIDAIIDYLDYINRVRYTEVEISTILCELEKHNQLKKDNQLWYSTSAK